MVIGENDELGDEDEDSSSVFSDNRWFGRFEGSSRSRKDTTMTRGGLSVDQKMVTNFIFTKVKSVSDLKDGIDISDLSGEKEILDFPTILNFLSRGLCLDLQRKERGTTSVSIGKIKDELRRRGINPDDIINEIKNR